jgi:hypothetical protein
VCWSSTKQTSSSPKCSLFLSWCSWKWLIWHLKQQSLDHSLKSYIKYMHCTNICFCNAIAEILQIKQYRSLLHFFTFLYLQEVEREISFRTLLFCHSFIVFFTFLYLQEVEREISFRTESGLYYSYYKTMVLAPSITEGKFLFNLN